MELFKLVGRILVDSDEANKSISKTEKSGSGLASGLGKVAKGAAVVTGAIAAAGTAIMALATKGAETSDRIDKMSQKLGFSREGFQEWDYVLSQNGYSIDSLGSGIKTLTDQFDDMGKGGKVATEAFNRIGLSYEDLQGLTQEEIFEKTIKGLQNVEDEAERAALANDLLGRSGKELAPLLNAGAESVDELKNKARDLGLVMGDEVIDAGVNLTDTLDTLKRTLSATLVPVLAGIMPLVQNIAELIIGYMPQIMGMLTPLFDSLMPIFSDLVMSLMPILIDLAGIFLTQVLPAIMPLIQVIVEKLLPPIMKMLGELGGTLFPILADVITVVAEVLTPFIELLAELLELILPPLMAIIKVVAGVIKDYLMSAFEAIQPIVDNVIGIFTNIIEFIKNVFSGNWSAAWDNIVGIFRNIFEGIINFVKAPINAVIGLINKLFEKIGTINLPEWLGGPITLKPIPLLAKGGIITEPGLAMTGENGPELINLPRGASVTPLENGNMPGKKYEQTFNFFGDTSPYGVMRAARKARHLAALEA